MVYKYRRRILSVFFAIILIATAPFRTFAAGVDLFFCEHNPILYSCVNPCSSSSSPNARNISTTGGCGVDEANNQGNKDQVWGFLVNKFKGKGYNDQEAAAAAAGVMGNWTQESTVNSHLTTKGMGCTNSPAYGIAQWCFGRIDNLKKFAADHGADPTCLGTQLDFMWGEMEGPYSGLIPAMKGVSPSQAAHIFNLGGGGASGYEVGADDDKRQGYADQVFKEYTGKDASSVTPTGNSTGSSGSGSSSSSGSGASCGGANVAGGPIPSANCQATQQAMHSLIDSGKITLEQNGILDDIDKCTDQKIPPCTSGASTKDTAGARPQTLRGLAAIAQNSGVNTMRLWNINEGHGCDQFDHPKGLASDIKQADGVECSDANPDSCKKIFDYIIAHADELGVSYVIWDGPYCQQKAASNKLVDCNGEHNNHIHLSFKDN